MTADVSKDRTRNYLHQIKGAVVYKVLAMTASFLAIPIMIHYLGQEQFGVWSTLLTVMSWVVFFDLGVGNGLRNKVAEALARNDQVEAANFIASGYGLIGLIVIVLCPLMIGVSFFVRWQTIFNTQAIPEATLRLTVQIAAFFVLLNFWLGLIGALLGAVQKTAIAALGQLIANVLALLFVFVLAQYTKSSITYLAIAYGISLVLANATLTLWFYQRYRELRPSASLDKEHINPLLSIGVKFFIIQIAVLVIFTTDKMLITQLFGPQYIAQYEVIFKLFSVITFFHTLISAPLWSAYTDAYHRADMVWMRTMLRKQQIIFSGIVMAVIVMGFLAQPIIAVWIGSEVIVSVQLVIAMGMFVLILTWNNIYAMFVNGIGDIRIQLYTAVIAMLMNIPLSIIFVKYFSLGLSGIILATIVSLSLAAIALPIQVNKIICSGTKIIPT